MKQFLLFVILFSCTTARTQHQDKVDFIRADVLISTNPEKKEIKGVVTYELKVLANLDSIFMDAKNMRFSSVLLDHKKVQYQNDDKTITIHKIFKKGENHLLTLSYTCVPKQTVYFVGYDDDIAGNEQIWTQGQGKYTSHWLPSIDAMEEKVEFDLNFNKSSFANQIIANGNVKKVISNHNGGFIVSYDMKKPMSSYLLAFALGHYDKQELVSKSGIPIENYYYPKDSLKTEPTYRYTKEIFDFLEDEIGVGYPWQNYKQVPVRDFLYAGMENTSATIFSDQYVIDATTFVDKNYVNVNAHELAHQWFGNLVTEKDGNHHWLHEGFATYYAQLAEKELFGEEHYYWKLYSSLKELHKMDKKGEGQSLMDAKASSLTFYEKGAWALYMLRARVGELHFKKGIKQYLKKYKFKNVTIDQFITEIESAHGESLAGFKKNWLAATALPFEEAKKQLAIDSPSLSVWFEMQEELIKKGSNNFDYMKYWDTTNSIHLRKELLQNYHSTVPKEIWAKAFKDSITVRQVIAQEMDTIPTIFLNDFQSLLRDKSYVTIENALFKLWAANLQERATYLEQTKSIIGLPNKNVRLLWLTLAVLTNEYEGRNTQKYFQELSGYTSKQYGWEIRMGAFQYLKQALGINQQSLKNLVNATNHHSWQFKKFARNLLDELLKDADYKLRLQALANELNAEETRYLKSKLKVE